jgi:hypothetical protein
MLASGSDGEARARPSSGPDSRSGVWRQLAVAVLCLGGVGVFASFVDPIYPIRTWLAWPTFAIWGWVALLHATCLGLGARVTIDWLRVRDRPPLETLTLAMAVGVVGWVLLMYIVGALGLFGRALVFVLPPPLIWAGAGPLRASVTRWREERVGSLAPRSALSTGIAAFGVLCLGLMYLQLFSPDSLNYDSTWCHLTVAQDYAREGRIVPFPADYAENVPQLTPMVHLFGFLAPGLNQPLRWMFALHDEFAFFLWTLVGVSATVCWIIGEDTPRGPVWAAFFLFPGIFVYDSNLGGAADHLLAFFALPIFLATSRLGAQPTNRNAILWGLVCGGAILTKYQAVYVILPATALLAIRWCARGRPIARAFDRGEAVAFKQLAQTAIVAGAALTVVIAPHFLRNLIFYKNPVYPLMQDVFTASTPRVPGGSFLVAHVFTDVNWVPKGTLVEKLINASKLFFKFSFLPHYSFEIHHDAPFFGSLFTLLLPVVPFFGRRPRLWAVVGCASGAILIWALTFLVDRNLQTFLPLLVAATGAILVLAWRTGIVARVGLVPLVAMQLVWSGDAFFRSGYDRMRSAFDLIGSGYAGTAATRFAGYRSSYVTLGEALPRDATVLLHASHVHLGINRRVVLDWAGFQGMFDYRSVRSLAALDALYRSHGVTHIVRESGQRLASTKQEDVLFALYVGRYATSLGNFRGLELYALPPTPPPADPRDHVVMAGVHGYDDGIYTIDQLGAYEGLLDIAPSYPHPEAPFGDPAGYRHLVHESLAVIVGNARTPPPLLMTEASLGAGRSPLSPGGLTIYSSIFRQ